MITLQPHVYHSFLEHCPSSDLRRNTYRAYNMRASNHIDQELSNSIHMEDIRSLRYYLSIREGDKSSWNILYMNSRVSLYLDFVLCIVMAINTMKDNEKMHILNLNCVLIPNCIYLHPPEENKLLCLATRTLLTCPWRQKWLEVWRMCCQ